MGKEETNAFFFFFFPPPTSQPAGHNHILFSTQNWIYFFSLVYRTVQASNCQLAVTRKEISCIVEAKQESRRINTNNSAEMDC